MLLVEAILFGLFTLCMMADQLDSVTSNQTQIDRLKNQKHIIQSDINEVFGTPSQLKYTHYEILNFISPIDLAYFGCSLFLYRILRNILRPFMVID